MVINSFDQVLQSPVIAKLLVLSCAAAVFLVLRSKDAEGHAGAFLAALGILALRDALTAVFPVTELFYLSDLFYFGFILFIYLSPFGAPRLTLVLALAVNVAAAGLYAARLFAGFGAFVPAWAFPALLVADSLCVAAFAFAKRKDVNGSQRALVSRTWPLAGAVLLAYSVLAWVLGYGTPLFEGLVVPVSYLWLVLSGLMGLGIQDELMVSAVSYYEASIDSLYNLFTSTGSALKGSFAMEDVLRSMNETMVAETGADGGTIYLVDEFDDLIVAKAYSGSFPPPFPLPESLPRKQSRVEAYMKHAQFTLGENILGEAAKSGKNIYLPDARADGRLASNGDEDFLRISSFMAVPLMVDEKIIGVSAVAKTKDGREFDEADFDRFKLLANFGTLAVSNVFSFLEANERSGIERQAGIAAEIQLTIIPKKLPQYPRLGIGAFTTPARGVSGDYYDVIRTREDRIVGVVGDVAGKGVQAALIMVMIRSILHLITNTNKDIATVLDWVNRGITGKIDMDHYATLGIVAVNIQTGELEYSNAAHQPLLVYRAASDTVEAVEIKSVPIGVEKTTAYARKALRLGDGDIAVLYTDGIVEAMNEQGKQFGRKSLGQVVSRHRDLAPRDIVGKIKSELAAFVGTARQHDDQTVLVFKMKL